MGAAARSVCVLGERRCLQYLQMCGKLCDATWIPLEERIILAHFSHFLLLDVSCFFSLTQKSLVIKITYCFRGFHTFLFRALIR